MESEKNKNLEKNIYVTDYLSDNSHYLLSKDARIDKGPNIGDLGQNLTISFLSLNRSAKSIKLLFSIAKHLNGFAGKVLIIDNGSQPSELEMIRLACSEMPFCNEIIELGTNYGVAGGRNRAMPYITTDWVMFLDNDMYFINNPLESLQRDIAILGCHFINIPFLSDDQKTIIAKGGHLYTYIEQGETFLSECSAYCMKQYDGCIEPPFMSTFLYGGTSVLNKHTFTRLGGFDEGMFIGFEDLDFSIRIFQEGLKIGNIGYCALVHDHSVAVNNYDKEYEQIRCSYKIIKQSATYFENKHGLKVWNKNIEYWLKMKQ